MARNSRAPLSAIVRAPTSVDELIAQLPEIAGQGWAVGADGSLRNADGRDVICALVLAANPAADFKTSGLRALQAALGNIPAARIRIVREFVVACDSLEERLKDDTKRGYRTRILAILNPRGLRA